MATGAVCQFKKRVKDFMVTILPCLTLFCLTNSCRSFLRIGSVVDLEFIERRFLLLFPSCASVLQQDIFMYFTDERLLKGLVVFACCPFNCFALQFECESIRRSCKQILPLHPSTFTLPLHTLLNAHTHTRRPPGGFCFTSRRLSAVSLSDSFLSLPWLLVITLNRSPYRAAAHETPH